MSGLLEGSVVPVALARLSTLLPPERVRRVEEHATARRLLDGRTLWNVSSTARGGVGRVALPVESAHTCVVSREDFAPEWVDRRPPPPR